MPVPRPSSSCGAWQQHRDEVQRPLPLPRKVSGVQLGVVILPELGWAESEHRWRHAEELGFAHAWTYDHLTWRSFR